MKKFIHLEWTLVTMQVHVKINEGLTTDFSEGRLSLTDCSLSIGMIRGEKEHTIIGSEIGLKSFLVSPPRVSVCCANGSVQFPLASTCAPLFFVPHMFRDNLMLCVAGRGSAQVTTRNISESEQVCTRWFYNRALLLKRGKKGLFLKQRVRPRLSNT